MKEEYNRLLDFEHQLVQHVVPPHHPHVKMLHKHILTVLTVPCRLLMDAFHHSEFRLDTQGEEAAKHLLKVLCATFADNKIIEDVHGTLGARQEAKFAKK